MNKESKYALIYASIISLGGFLFGFDASVISGVVGYVSQEFGLSDWQQGFVVSSPTLGAVIASICMGPLSDLFGRKKVILTIAFLYTLSASASAVAPDYATLVSARFIGGLAFGSLIIAPIYIAEISPSKLRGRFVSINQFNIVVGFSAAYFANYFLLNASESGANWVAALGIDAHTWRWMLGLEIIPAMLFFLALLAVPESPRWLVANGRSEQAKTVLGKIAPSTNVEEQIQAIKATLFQTVDTPFMQRLKELLSPRLRKAIVIGLIVGVAQQITGVNAVYFYAPSIFEQSGVGTNAAFAQAIWVGIINVIFTIVAMACIDRIGRRPLMLIGLGGVFVSMMLTAYGFHSAYYQLSPQSVSALEQTIEPGSLDTLVGKTFDNDVAFKKALGEALGGSVASAHESSLIQAAIHANATLILVGILGFVASFAVSLGPVMWVLLSEIFPNRIRGIAISFIGLFNSAVSFSVQFVFPWELSTLGSAGTFLIFGLFAGIGIVLVYRILPETKGKSLEELEAELAA